MAIDKGTTVSQLRAKDSDYTILRKLVKQTGAKESAYKLAKRHGSAYKAARLLLGKAKRQSSK